MSEVSDKQLEIPFAPAPEAAEEARPSPPSAREDRPAGPPGGDVIGRAVRGLILDLENDEPATKEPWPPF